MNIEYYNNFSYSSPGIYKIIMTVKFAFFMGLFTRERRLFQRVEFLNFNVGYRVIHPLNKCLNYKFNNMLVFTKVRLLHKSANEQYSK